MIKVNKTILNLTDIFSYMSVAMTLSVLENFTQSRNSFNESKDFLVENIFEFGQHVDEVSALTEQIEILDKNIKNLVDALLCHESKCIEKRFALKDLQAIGLN